MLTDNITFPADTKHDSITISANGAITYTTGTNQQGTAGPIQLARFLNPSGLTSIGRNLFMQSEASGEPQVAEPETDGMGSIIQNCLEMSSVQIVDEMVNMIIAQRAYEMNSKAITASDEMLQQANNLRS